jgi:hypothetical protein
MEPETPMEKDSRIASRAPVGSLHCWELVVRLQVVQRLKQIALASTEESVTLGL